MSWDGRGPESKPDDVIAGVKRELKRRYSYGKGLDTGPEWTAELTEALLQWQRIVHAEVAAGLRPPPDVRTDGRIDWGTQVQLGLIDWSPPAPERPLFLTVEGHMSNMWAGPVADTATQMEAEGRCWHQPVGYNAGAIPFDNDSGVRELARLVGSTTLDNGRAFPAGTPLMLGGFSQGGIVVFDFYTRYMLPGQPLHWRAKDLRGVLMYGNPCRQQGAVAPWAMPWVKNVNTHGLDPYRRFGVPGMPDGPSHPWAEVWREGDIFAQNGDDKASAVKASVYQAIARGDLFSDPYSLAAQIADVFNVGFDQVLGIVFAIVSGVGFLATGGANPHYSPFDIEGGKHWARELLDTSVIASRVVGT